MPHLRQRMRCRRGSSRGKILRPPSSTLSDSSSPSSSQFTGRYPETRTGRGRTRPESSRPVETALHSSVTFASSSPATQSAQFHFRCTLDRPCIIATISVEFREEPPLSDNFVQSDMKNKGLAQDSKLASKQSSKSPVPATPQKATVKRKATSSSGSCGSGDEHGCFAPTEADADMDDYRCRIVEEPLPAPNDT